MNSLFLLLLWYISVLSLMKTRPYEISEPVNKYELWNEANSARRAKTLGLVFRIPTHKHHTLLLPIFFMRNLSITCCFLQVKCDSDIGQTRLIRSHSSARFCLDLRGNSNCNMKVSSHLSMFDEVNSRFERKDFDLSENFEWTVCSNYSCQTCTGSTPITAWSCLLYPLMIDEVKKPQQLWCKWKPCVLIKRVRTVGGQGCLYSPFNMLVDGVGYLEWVADSVYGMFRSLIIRPLTSGTYLEWVADSVYGVFRSLIILLTPVELTSSG